jgi:hypothetical protein
MKRHIKKFLETASGNRMTIEHPSSDEEVMQLIKLLRPIATSTPLVRVGSKGDGGYLLPDDLDGIAAAISPGVSTEVSFDLELAEKGIPVYMADASVTGPPVPNPRFYFLKKFVDVYEDDHTLRLHSLCSMSHGTSPDDRLLQMDIEGAEYRVLLDATDEVIRSFRVMAIEFHYLDSMYSSFSLKLIRATFQKILRTHHIVHLHPNNGVPFRVRGSIAIPPIMEFTFYRKDRCKVDFGKELIFPHPLDADNVPTRPHLALPEVWR